MWGLLLKNWKLVIIGVLLLGMVVTIKIEKAEISHYRNKAAILQEQADQTKAAYDIAVKVAARKEKDSAAVTQRVTDELLDKTASLTAAQSDADSLRKLLASSQAAAVPGVSVSGTGAVDTAPSASSISSPSPEVLAFTTACELDSAELKGWQDWYREQTAIFRPESQ